MRLAVLVKRIQQEEQEEEEQEEKDVKEPELISVGMGATPVGEKLPDTMEILLRRGLQPPRHVPTRALMAGLFPQNLAPLPRSEQSSSGKSCLEK